MDEAYGLDIAGYSTEGSGLAKAHRIGTGEFVVTVFTNHCFSRKVEGHQLLTAVQGNEIDAIVFAISIGCLVVDTPLDLQGLPALKDATYAWELALRPVDYALDTRPPLADRIGYPVSRFQNLYRSLPHSVRPCLGRSLFETYPAAALRLNGLQSTKYKGEAVFHATEGWLGKDAVRWDKKRRVFEPDVKQAVLNDRFAETLNRLGWRLDEDGPLDHDEFDASICAITGASEPANLLDGENLKRYISEGVLARLTKGSKGAEVSTSFRAEPPQGYRLLRSLPKEVVIRRAAAFPND